MRINQWILPFFCLLILGVSSCVDLEFDEPPVGDLPKLEANATIAEIKTFHTIGNDASRIEEDLVIAGIVIADDESGNFYQNIVIQDATGGIAVRMRTNGLFGDFPIGREVYVKVQGLFIGDYNGLYQLNGSAENAIEEVLIPDHVIGGAYDKEVTPRLITLDELNNSSLIDELQNTLIKLEDVQFTLQSSGTTYADAVTQFSVNHLIEDCDEQTIILRNSGFADFASDPTPNGNGSLTAVFSVFRNDLQLFIRNIADVQMNNTRCGAGSGNESQISIEEVRNLYTGGATQGPDERKIKGVVISDIGSNSITGRNVVIQDGEYGIVVRFTTFHNFALGDEIEVIISGMELSEFNGLMQVNDVPNGLASKVGDGTLPTPREATIGQVLANMDNWESTLIQLKDVTLSGGGTYSGNVTVSDGSDEITLYTPATATFSGNPLPAGNAEIVAIVSEFNIPQLIIRNLNDVTAEGGTGGDPEEISLADLRDLFEGGAGAAPANKFLKGVVISDGASGNMTGRNLVIQDASGGIVVRFADNHNFALGEELEITISGMELSEYNGLLQLNNIPNANATSGGIGTLPTPREATLQEVINNLEEWESTLVKISGVTIPEGGTYSGSKTLTDSSGSVVMFTRTQADFASDNVPAGEFTVTGMISDFNEAQIIIRNLDDIVE
ncbi:MAG: hypothetical protein DHS20C18_12450 [Saprospiraceae bacterium]|nr:MAG: hypothetical protein DHS20C18_12450 [Saprospiraceae bacterium]